MAATNFRGWRVSLCHLLGFFPFFFCANIWKTVTFCIGIITFKTLQIIKLYTHNFRFRRWDRINIFCKRSLDGIKSWKKVLNIFRDGAANGFKSLTCNFLVVRKHLITKWCTYNIKLLKQKVNKCNGIGTAWKCNLKLLCTAEQSQCPILRLWRLL